MTQKIEELPPTMNKNLIMHALQFAHEVLFIASEVDYMTTEMRQEAAHVSYMVESAIKELTPHMLTD